MVLYCIVLRSWLRRAGCVSQDAYIVHDILSSWVTNYFYPARARALFRSEMYRMLSWNCMVLPGISLYRLVYLLPLNGITWYCIVLYCVVGFGARAVSRKTPIYFMQVYFWEIGHHPLCWDNLICQGDKLCCLIEKWYFLKA